MIVETDANGAVEACEAKLSIYDTMPEQVDLLLQRSGDVTRFLLRAFFCSGSN